MARQIVYSLQEILAKDINNLRNTSDKTLLDIVLGNALPRLPAFIGNGFKVSISGNNVTVDAGICFQSIPQTDGSSNIRIAHLEAQQTLNVTLSTSATVMKVDLVECRSVLTNLPTESRKFSDPGGVVDRNVVTQNMWGAEVQVKENVTPNAQGDYDASEGWVGIAIVRSNNVAIQSVEDVRNFYNLFDADFFSVYGRKNIGFHKKWDGVPLVEVPFEFSDLVSKLSQVSVRRLTKERYGQIVITNSYNTNYAFIPPTATVSTLKPLNQLTFLTYISARTQLNVSTGSNKLNLSGYERFFSNERDSYRLEVEIGISGVNKNKLIPEGSGDDFFEDFAGFERDSLIRNPIYIVLSNQDASQYLVWRIPSSQIIENSRSDSIRLTGSAIDPMFKNADMASNLNYVTISQVDPLTTVTGIPNYRKTTETVITSFYTIKDIIFNPSLNQVKFTLEDKTSGTTEFPANGRVFNVVKLKKGTETRLTINITDMTISRPQDADSTSTEATATYTYNLTSQDTLIKDTDTTHTDWNIEFDIYNTTGEDIWRANSLRGGTTLGATVDFVIVNEGLRTYVRFNPQFPFKTDDELIFSHIIPQALVDAGSGGTPEEQTAEAQITALRDQVTALTRRVTENEGDISTLENASAAGDVVFYYGIISISGGKTSTTRANAKSTTFLTPLVNAEIANTAERTEKTVSSLTLGGGLVQFTAGASTGYYSPWVAIETVEIGNGSLYVLGPNGDESDLWRPLGSATLNSKSYNLYGRIAPLGNGKTLRVVFRIYS